MPPDVLETANAWLAAANAQDRERLLALSAPEIEVSGPRGGGHGQALLLKWLDRAGLTARTVRTFIRDSDVVVAQHSVWRSRESGDVSGEADLASHLRIVDGRVISVARYDTLGAALAAAGLDAANEVPAAGHR